MTLQDKQILDAVILKNSVHKGRFITTQKENELVKLLKNKNNSINWIKQEMHTDHTTLSRIIKKYKIKR